MTQYFGKSIDETLEALDVRADDGLGRSEVVDRQERFGRNRLRVASTRPAWRILLDQFLSVVIILLVAAAIASAALGHVVESIAIAAAVLVNTLIGFFMEMRATRAMESLHAMQRLTARVIRDGSSQEIDAQKLVPGDIVQLDAGDVVAADLRLIETNHLRVNESALTGESVPVDKQTDALTDTDVPLAERSNMAFKGTAVTDGTGAGVAVATGTDTEIGHISEMAQQAEESRTPLERRLDRLGRRLTALVVVIAMLTGAVGLLVGKDWMVMLETAIALAIAAVPEGLPVVATLALAHGMRRMARRNALVRRLSAVETLGAANVIFTDKTGTLTENRMTLDRLRLADGEAALGDQGFSRDGETLDIEDSQPLRAALSVGALCNNATLGEDREDADDDVGDPTELALLNGAAAAGLDREDLLDEEPEEREVGFDAEIKMMATFHQRESGYRVAVKGAPEAVLEHCRSVLGSHGEQELDDSARQEWQQAAEAMAEDGLRVLALAQREAQDSDEDPYQNLTLVGLAGLYDPPREDIPEAIAACQKAGIRVIMGTGDHAATASAIAREIGLADQAAMEGSELARLTGERDADDEAPTQDILEQNVFARISPEQKLNLIGWHQNSGAVVGMTGDGVNDAPGLKKADIGIAMGQRGTEVAKDAADMILQDDAFETIVVAVEYGRTIFRNIRRFIVYLVSGNLGEIMAITAAVLMGYPLPLLPLQILYINFISDVMPALALGLTPGQRDVMNHPPRDPEESILERRHWLAITAYGAVIAGSVMVVFVVMLSVLERPVPEAVSAAFLTFGFARLWHVLNMRAPDSPLLRNEITTNPWIWVALLVGVLLLLASIYVPLLAGLLSVVVPDATTWTLMLGMSLVPIIIGLLAKYTPLIWQPRSHPERGDDSPN